ncbi:hypothetical protein IVB22_34780 [Bradyrhizobium sp. 190]|uniref:hypothetical protein n=1 Tax=Bradyrhizobium sp. 190 TaxID=2782658 RepID=UPI001FF9AAE0|nr:hypothetical protein [Bradyrhizobium sp. 190]MCK1517560.1 hypothetical protein [Bradyrhizobium sp. 190]
MLVNAATGVKRPAFDQTRLAAALNEASHKSYQADDLPFRHFELPIMIEGSASASRRIPPSWDGSEGNYYAFSALSWSPDSRDLAAYRIRPGFKRKAHYVNRRRRTNFNPTIRR